MTHTCWETGIINVTTEENWVMKEAVGCGIRISHIANLTISFYFVVARRHGSSDRTWKMKTYAFRERRNINVPEGYVWGHTLEFLYWKVLDLFILFCEHFAGCKYKQHAWSDVRSQQKMVSEPPCGYRETNPVLCKSSQCFNHWTIYPAPRISQCLSCCIPK